MLCQFLKSLKAIKSGLLFEDAQAILRVSRNRVIQPEDLLALPPGVHPRNTQVEEEGLNWGHRWGLILSLLRARRKEVASILSLRLGAAVLGLASPYLVNRLIQRIQAGVGAPAALTEAIACALLLGGAGAVTGLCTQHHFFRELRLHLVYINVLNRKVFAHSLELSKEARQRTTVGDVVNHMSTDSETIADIAIFAPELVSSVFMTVGAVLMLFHFIGWSAVGALVLMAVVGPLAQKATYRYRRLDGELMRYRDQRITLMSQVLNAIRVVKYFVWEKSVEQEVGEIRAKELECRRQVARSVSFATLGFAAVPTLVLFTALLTHVLRGQPLDVATVFTCVALFSLLERPFEGIAYSASSLINAGVSADRIVGFLRQEKTPALKTAAPAGETGDSKGEGPVSLLLRDVTVAFQGQAEPVLRKLSLELSAGGALAIVGGVGVGKSTLIDAILGELALREGEIAFRDPNGGDLRPRIAYVPQEAYIINGTLRENILFGVSDVSEEQIAEAVRVSCLEHDLGHWPGGLDTEIGEKGVNLSGGQKQRVSLARAFLQRPQLALLDDPLSAVDVETEGRLVEQLLFGAWGAREASGGVTRVMVTHRLESLPRFDRILLLEEGKVAALGTYEELRRESDAFRAFIHQHERTQGEASPVSAIQAPQTTAATVGPASRITEDEDRETGAVRGSVYVDYLRALGGEDPRFQALRILSLFGFAVLVTAMPILQRAWLAKPSDAVGPLKLVLVYGALGLLTLLATVGNRLYWLNRAILAGRSFHDRMLKAVLKAPVRFFDSTPVGRILQRFSRDVESVDAQLQWTFTEVVFHALHVVASLVLIVGVLPALVVFLLPVMGLYYLVQRDYRGAAREAKRLDSISRSPRYAHFKETLQGLVIIRGFRRSAWFTEGFFDRLAHSQRMFYNHFLLNRWFSARIPLIGGAVSAGTATGVAIAASRGIVSPGVAGLLITYSLSFWQYLNWMVRTFADVESRMTSVERLNFFAGLPAERDVVSEAVSESESESVQWPVNGRVVFDDVRARYASHLPLVLNGVSFAVEPGTRVGVVGRTGSGKSTLFQALFRFIELEGGSIRIDGRDIAGIPLARLRSALAIIPQDPTLFMGTLRSNLDRYAQFSDEAVWDALERAALAGFVRSLPAGLATEVVEGGLNLSQGQRQLLCLARALLLKSRIIVLDEATASVDVQTDAILQRVLRESFPGVTQLIIAHRLGTVRDCDQIVEIAEGRVKSVIRGAEAPAARLEALEVQ